VGKTLRRGINRPRTSGKESRPSERKKRQKHPKERETSRGGEYEKGSWREKSASFCLQKRDSKSYGVKRENERPRGRAARKKIVGLLHKISESQAIGDHRATYKKKVLTDE